MFSPGVSLGRRRRVTTARDPVSDFAVGDGQQFFTVYGVRRYSSIRRPKLFFIFMVVYYRNGEDGKEGVGNGQYAIKKKKI